MKVKWDVQVIESYQNLLMTERENLEAQKSNMLKQKETIGTNWKSSAGQDYQNRLSGDMELIDNILKQLDRQLIALKNAAVRYRNCEESIKKSASRLP